MEIEVPRTCFVSENPHFLGPTHVLFECLCGQEHNVVCRDGMRLVSMYRATCETGVVGVLMSYTSASLMDRNLSKTAGDW